jgi:hypothetical protein
LRPRARAEFERNPLPGSATPLADRLGVAGWLLDLLHAALGSLVGNGLAMCLLGFAGRNGPFV